MPNHVTHNIIITGPAEDIAKFHATFFTEANEGFDFETLIPMPEVLKGTEESSWVNWGLYLLGKPSDFSYRTAMEWDWVKEAGVTNEEDLKALMRVKYPTAITVAERSLRAIAETGYPSWYRWAIAKWGTKWNAYRSVWDEEGYLRFETAWDTPEGIWVALAQRPEVQNLRIEIDAFDEGWNFAYHAVIEDGLHEGFYVEATPEMYETVYGEAPEPEDEE